MGSAAALLLVMATATSAATFTVRMQSAAATNDSDHRCHGLSAAAAGDVSSVYST